MYSGGVPGPTGLAVEITDPIDCFHLFLSPDIYDELLVQTNLYAAGVSLKCAAEARHRTTPPS